MEFINQIKMKRSKKMSKKKMFCMILILSMILMINFISVDAESVTLKLGNKEADIHHESLALKIGKTERSIGKCDSRCPGHLCGRLLCNGEICPGL